jgi:two-component sensor histidine kinase
VQPILAEIFVNHKKWSGSKKEFSANENNLEMRFFALNFRQNGKIPYRFRLHEKAEWQMSMATTALFSSLATGYYRFEVQAQNEDEVWGESTFFSFEILPPWWKTWWFYSFVLGLAVAAGIAFFRYRTEQLKTQFAVQNQISELEQTALRAQMNPHFISNCLNSIQRCVLENNNEAAVKYLARFAKLTRTALEFSGRPQISLAEEITYLENYLALEKLRFKAKFDFKIEVADGLDTRKTMLPPMLVQPLAENSIHHGFAKMQEGGQIEIHFSKNTDHLKVICTDNGQGLNDDFLIAKNEDSEHALQLIDRRLTLLKQTGKYHGFQIRNRTDGNRGTLAVFELA